MATNTTLKPTKMQTELDAAATGLSNSTITTLGSMMVLGVMMSKADVIAKLKSLSAVYAAATNARSALSVAVNARIAAKPSTEAFYEAVVMALNLALGPSNQGMLPGFGVALPKARKEASVEAKTIAKAKSAATRAARGTKGKAQRLAITTQPSMSLQVLGTDGLPLVSTASSSTASASTVSTSASTVITPESSSTAPKSAP
jgi:hypothetical protein